jgi:hypothetical protein
MTGAEAEGSAIPKVVPVEGLALETREAAEAAPEPTQVASEGAPMMAEERNDELLPDASREVVVRSPEIQDAEPIRSVPMSGAATSSCGGIELLADDRVDPAAGRSAPLEGDAPGRAVDEGKLSTQLSSQSLSVEYPSDDCCLLQHVVERSRQKSDMLQGYGDTVLRVEALEEQLAKARKHSAMLQSKLDGAFAQYHNEVQDMQAKSDELVRKNKSLRNKNKGTLLSCRVPIRDTLQ